MYTKMYSSGSVKVMNNISNQAVVEESLVGGERQLYSNYLDVCMQEGDAGRAMARWESDRPFFQEIFYSQQWRNSEGKFLGAATILLPSLLDEYELHDLVADLAAKAVVRCSIFIFTAPGVTATQVGALLTAAKARFDIRAVRGKTTVFIWRCRQVCEMVEERPF